MLNDQIKKDFAAILKAAQEKAANTDRTAKAKFATPKPTPAPVAAAPVKEYDNLKDIEAAAKSGEVISILNLHNLVNAPAAAPAPQPVPAANVYPGEIGTTTLNDLFSSPAAIHGAASEEKAAEVFTSAENVATQPEAVAAVEVAVYSPKSFVVRGEGTKAVKDQLHAAGGTWNRYLKGGAGWIFSNKRRQQVEQILKAA